MLFNDPSRGNELASSGGPAMSESTSEIRSCDASSWYRRIKPWQFSLRTLLVIMAIASAVCWYFLLPKKHDEKLANGYLILQRQYRGTIHTGLGGSGVNDGYWRLKDLEGRFLVDGNYRQDEKHGWWTMYHPNGRKAVQGKMWKGKRNGIWKTWSEDGQLLSEVTYGSQQPLNPFAIEQDAESAPLYGGARFWHANGKPSSAGKFENNERAGPWEEWDEQGTLIAAGEYRDGKKHGAWQELAIGEKKLIAQTYVNGLRQEQLTARLQKLAEQLDQAELSHRVTLLQVATELGEPALPLLEKWAAGDERSSVQLAAIQGIGRCGGKMQPWERALQAIAATEDQLLARGARRELYLRLPDTRAEHFAAMISDAEQLAEVSPNDGIQLLREMFMAEPSRRSEILAVICQVVRYTDHAGAFTFDPTETPESVVEWHATLLPFIEQKIVDANPQTRRDAVRLIKLILVERNEPLAASQGRKWRIPAPLVPLVERGRSDADISVKGEAVTVDEVYAHGFGGGGFGGGGLF